MLAQPLSLGERPSFAMHQALGERSVHTKAPGSDVASAYGAEWWLEGDEAALVVSPSFANVELTSGLRSPTKLKQRWRSAGGAGALSWVPKEGTGW